MSTTCNGCGALVIWASHVETASRAPIDAEPSPDGSILILGHTWRIVKPEDRHKYTYLHTPHLATCPNAKQFRRKEKTK